MEEKYMIENIVIRGAVTEEERSLFWERLRAYFCRDIFPDPEDEDRPYFLGDLWTVVSSR